MLVNSHAVPQLNTIYIKPLQFLQKQFLTQQKLIDEWFKEQWRLTTPPVYGSVDLRNAGFKLAPIDMNLFPAGFNNLNPNFLSLSASAALKVINKIADNVSNILLIPESHTRNLFYWENIKTLQKILEKAGFATQLGTLSADIKAPQEIVLSTGEAIIVKPLLRKDKKLYIDHFVPDLILLNNDLSEGIPDILQGLEQPLIPPAELGWSQRLKSEYFQYYANVAAEFSELVKIDPWLIDPLFEECGKVDFMQQAGLQCIISHAEVLFAEIQKKYDEYNIPLQPFLIVKANAGTYGMAVMTVRHVDELKNLNRKQRTRMASTKGGQPVHSVIIQEGVYTFETLGPEQAVAEPVVYLWGDTVVGGFYRVHKDRGNDENLNAPGMQFEPIAFPESCQAPCKEHDTETANLFYIYGIVAQLGMLAAAREIKDQTTK